MTMKLLRCAKTGNVSSRKQSNSFASAHIAYIQSLTNVSDALGESLDTFVTPLNTMAEPKLSVNTLMASGSRPVLVEQKPPTSPQTLRVQTYGADHFFPNTVNSQWDFFWNPFSSLDYYGYSYDNQGGKMRQEEGIPDLEEDESPRFQDHNMKKATQDCILGKMDQEDEVEHVNENVNCNNS